MSDNGLSVVGDKTQLITNTLSWEGPLVEAPWLIHVNGTYYLFYSANGYAGGKCYCVLLLLSCCYAPTD